VSGLDSIVIFNTSSPNDVGSSCVTVKCASSNVRWSLLIASILKRASSGLGLQIVLSKRELENGVWCGEKSRNEIEN